MPAPAKTSAVAAADTVMPVDSAVTIQEKPMYKGGFPGEEAIDTTVAPMSSLPVIERPSVQPATAHGHNLLHDTGSMSLMLFGLLLVAFSYRNGYKYVQNLAHHMFSTRRRENMFEDHTANEAQILTALIANTCIMEGLLIYMGLSHWMPSMRASLMSSTFEHVLLFTAVALGFYLLQLMVYRVLGYVFTDRVGTKLLLDGFKSTQATLGLLLFPIVALSLWLGNATKQMLICAIILYFCARIVFICKGFRIFYSKLTSLVYFILYLCAAEIVPLFIMGASTLYLSQLLLRLLNV